MMGSSYDMMKFLFVIISIFSDFRLPLKMTQVQDLPAFTAEEVQCGNEMF